MTASRGELIHAEIRIGDSVVMTTEDVPAEEMVRRAAAFFSQ
jgi:uncharacterized glyoxalase superfamily protein PhnB